jgi:hypothetical protein
MRSPLAAKHFLRFRQLGNALIQGNIGGMCHKLVD